MHSYARTVRGPRNQHSVLTEGVLLTLPCESLSQISGPKLTAVITRGKVEIEKPTVYEDSPPAWRRRCTSDQAKGRKTRVIWANPTII
ncbi:hypothetical protein PLICRDRAFT_572527 [Plicaturopsis crispa FD-325 SS-3]|nr:hypothetical protein PLICRDRAFT_572527 [Plicaturopsis crispa FD-325 SS-3]